MKKGQVFIGFGIIVAITAFIMTSYADKSKLALFLITGLMLGYVLQRSRFGFAGGVRKIAMTGDGKLSKALLFLFAITVIGTAGIHYAGAQGGAEAAFRAAKDVATIPGTGSVSAISLGFIVGGILFGIGMVLGGGCASGTLSDTGEGSVRGLIVLFFFCIGGMLGTWNLPSLKKTFLYENSLTVYLPDTFGYVGAVLVSLLLLLGLYFIVKIYENKRKKAGTQKLEEYAEWEKAIEEEKEYKVLSNKTYHKLFVERWSFFTGASLIAILFIFIINTTNSSWGASGPYTHWGVWLFSKLGIDFGAIEAFKGSIGVVSKGILNDPVSVRNIGIILGAAICMLLAGRWKLTVNFKAKDVAFYGLGGILMGYGAKLAGGCNVGALFSGIANLSLSGWVFLVTLVVGGLLGVKLVKKFNIPA
ncbi:YeeE/YedE family protein [Clostridium sp.]|uniref:YeeE/YedE family protein n=1 Tax=Clostridium sp. TaxID=1506 RepID=UPI001DCBB7CA|nr:YeeE/YedE family protein [Clostridium sp.]MBS5939052.1 YeeE/YedE family protein [Clostridium sp.]